MFRVGEDERVVSVAQLSDLGEDEAATAAKRRGGAEATRPRATAASNGTTNATGEGRTWRTAHRHLSRHVRPVTNGHVDIIRRATHLVDQLVVGVA